MDQPPFDVKVTNEGDSTVVSLSGELDLTGVARATGAFDALAPAPGAVVVDLTGLTFIDSSGISVLIRAKNACDAAGRAIRLRGPQGKVRELLELTSLDRVIGIQ